MHRAVHVGLEAPEEVDAVLYVSYVVTNASWSSAYDIRVFTKDKNMKVSSLESLSPTHPHTCLHVYMSTHMDMIGTLYVCTLSYSYVCRFSTMV